MKYKVGDIVIYKDETSAYHLKRCVVEQIPELLGIVDIRLLDDPTISGFVDFDYIELDKVYLQQEEAKKLLGLK